MPYRNQPTESPRLGGNMLPGMWWQAGICSNLSLRTGPGIEYIDIYIYNVYSIYTVYSVMLLSNATCCKLQDAWDTFCCCSSNLMYIFNPQHQTTDPPMQLWCNLKPPWSWGVGEPPLGGEAYRFGWEINRGSGRIQLKLQKHSNLILIFIYLPCNTHLPYMKESWQLCIGFLGACTNLPRGLV